MISVEKLEVWRTWGEPEEKGIPINDFILRSTNGTPIPDGTAADATHRFEVAQRENPTLHDLAVPFLLQAAQGRAVGVIAPRPFRYALAFNRDETWAYDDKLYATHKLAQLGTHLHILTADGFLVYARKTNQRDQLSGFGGQMQCDRFTRDGVVLVEAALRDRLTPEIGVLAGTLVDIRVLGMSYAATSFLRGADIDLLARSTATSEIWKERFARNQQFDEEIVLARPDADSLLQAIHVESESGGMFSPFAIACMYLLVCLTRSKSEALRFAHGARRLGYPIAIEAGEWYFGGS